MTYLQRLPEAIPEGQFLVHNSVRPTHPLGSHVSADRCKRKMSTALPFADESFVYGLSWNVIFHGTAEQRDREFADSPLQESGFEPLVPP
jgi:hypothetical protein